MLTGTRYRGRLGFGLTTTPKPTACGSVVDPRRDRLHAGGRQQYTATGTSISVDDHTRVCSVTILFTRTAALQLVDQGRIRLSDPISFSSTVEKASGPAGA
jgi:CubicO group peptidase (beta-lactamase class C family)